MAENQVTVDGDTRPLPEPFFVVATQNPHQYHGTYPLPEGQLDRFMISASMGYPDRRAELGIVRSQVEGYPLENVRPVAGEREVAMARGLVRKVQVHETSRHRHFPVLGAGAHSPGDIPPPGTSRSLAPLDDPGNPCSRRS